MVYLCIYAIALKFNFISLNAKSVCFYKTYLFRFAKVKK